MKYSTKKQFLKVVGFLAMIACIFLLAISKVSAGGGNYNAVVYYTDPNDGMEYNIVMWSYKDQDSCLREIMNWETYIARKGMQEVRGECEL